VQTLGGDPVSYLQAGTPHVPAHRGGISFRLRVFFGYGHFVASAVRLH
jgi:hypothetical protein